jgi:hypothetical protein
MDEKTSWIEGKRKVIVSILGILSTVGIAFGLSAVKMEPFVQVITVLAPTILALIYDIYNLQSKKEYTKQVEAEAQVAEMSTYSDYTPSVSIPTVTTPAAVEVVAPVPTPAEEVYPNLDTFMQTICDEIDQDLANRIAAGNIAGVMAAKVSKEQAKYVCPILSSDNPSMRYGRLLGRSEAIIVDGNSQALEFTEKLLLPTAMEALTDQMGSILASGNKCSWPPSPYAAVWVQSCQNHIAALQEIIKKKYCSFKNYSVWFAGEIAERWVFGKIPVATTYDKGEGKNWFYPEKPPGGLSL